MRIDIFVQRGAPDALVINENSLSSGMAYHMHFEFLAKLWAEPHLRKWYRVHPSNRRVYDLSRFLTV